MAKSVFLTLSIFSVVSIYGCVSSSHFHTGKTLEQNKFVLLFGADDIYIRNLDESVSLTKQPFVPSVGAAYGLPLRLETDIRWYIPSILQASVRHQINPRSFDLLDGSINLSYAHAFKSYSYLRYGFSLSKDIGGFEPYVHYSMYRAVGTEGDEWFGLISVSDITKDIINSTRSISFGIALPLRETKIFPEFSYQYLENELSTGLWRFGICFRAHLN